MINYRYRLIYVGNPLQIDLMYEKLIEEDKNLDYLIETAESYASENTFSLFYIEKYDIAVKDIGGKIVKWFNEQNKLMHVMINNTSLINGYRTNEEFLVTKNCDGRPNMYDVKKSITKERGVRELIISDCRVIKNNFIEVNIHES